MRIATIQARMNSTRLPGKVLLPLNGYPMIVQQVFRLSKTNLFDEIFVATTDKEPDDKLCEVLKSYKINYFRGSEGDVLGRLTKGLSDYGDECVHFEFSGDSPLSDIEIIKYVNDKYTSFTKQAGEFVTNGKSITFPNGTELCIYKMKILRYVDKQVSKQNPEREDVDKNFFRYLAEDKILNVTAPDCWFAPELYIEVDEQSDYELMEIIIENFQKKGELSYFPISNVIEFLRSRKHLLNINSDVSRKYWSYKR